MVVDYGMMPQTQATSVKTQLFLPYGINCGTTLSLTPVNAAVNLVDGNKILVDGDETTLTSSNFGSFPFTLTA